jgi:Ca2+-binding EF-hand superfamily protein
MGSAVSGLDEELKLPLNASDVDTPRGESAKQEVRRLRLFLSEKYYVVEQQPVAPSLQAYLEREFTIADVDGSGVLSSDEFWYMIREHLQLGLSDEDIAFLQSNGDLDNDGTVSWSEFIAMAPSLLQGMTRISDASHRDWCTFETDDGTPYYFNKRTNETYWEKPGEMMAEEAQGAFSSMAPGLQHVLNEWFTSSDSDQSGVLSIKQFQVLLGKLLGLEVEDETIEKFKIKYDFDEDGSINWSEFVTSIPEVLQMVIQKTRPSTADWCKIEGYTGKDVFYYNFRTGASTNSVPTLKLKGTLRVIKFALSGPRHMKTKLLGPDLSEIASEGGPSSPASVEVLHFFFFFLYLFER